MSKSNSALKVLGEGALIVVSVLLALSADAWLERLKERGQLQEHVAALSRDFAQMEERAKRSLLFATRGSESGRKLLEAIYAGEVDTDSTRYWIGMTQFGHEVFSPSIGAYQALIATGDIELLPDPELKRQLGEFFGSFDDLRVSERLLVDTQARLGERPIQARLAPMHRTGAYGIPLPPEGVFTQEAWGASPEWLHGLGVLVMRHVDVRNDYEFLLESIQDIRARLTVLQTDGSDS